MHTKQVKYFGIIFGFFLLCSCSSYPVVSTPVTVSPTATLEQPSGTWKVVDVYVEEHSIMTAGFFDAQIVATGGVSGRMAASHDGAKNWLHTDAAADCRYGIEIVSPQVIFACGGATQVRKSLDGGKTWQSMANFGNFRTITNPCHSMSFVDAETGWLANSNIFGTTIDGGATWQTPNPPPNSNQIATIDTYAPNHGYLLDQDGVLFFTQDNGLHWREVSKLKLGTLKMPNSVYQLAAMRFSDEKHGLIVISSGDAGKPDPVLAFRTFDGGQSWFSEPVPVSAGPVYLSPGGDLLTVISSVNALTLLHYEK